MDQAMTSTDAAGTSRSNGQMTRVPLSRCPPQRVVDPQHDAQLIDHFPNLIVRPEDPDERRAFESQHSILAGEAVRFAALLRAVLGARQQNTTRSHSIAEARWESLHAFFSKAYRLAPETRVRDRQFFDASLKAARETIEHVLAEYFPVMLRQRLKMSSVLSAEHDPVRLLRLCVGRGTDIMSRIRRFEARRLLTCAQIEFELRLHGNDPKTLDQEIASFVRDLDQGYFCPQKSDQVTVLAQLDPENSNRVLSHRLAMRHDPEARSVPSRTVAVLPLDVRFIRPRGSDRDIMVFFDARPKVHASLKLIRKRTRHHEALTDICGVKFVFFDEGELLSGVEHLRQTIVRAPGTVSGEASNAARAEVLDPQNRHSASEYRATKYEVRMGDRIIEIQFMRLPDYVNELVATGQENHPLYKLRTYLDLVFPVLFPTELYGLDWRDDALRQELWNLQIAKI